MSKLMKLKFNLNNIVNGIENVLTNSTVKYIISLLLIVALVTVKYHPDCCVNAHSTLWLQMIYILLIVYFACIEPLYAILLTGLLIANIYELRNRMLAKSAVALKLTQQSTDLTNPTDSSKLVVIGSQASSTDDIYKHLDDNRNISVPTGGELTVTHTADNPDQIISDHVLQNRVTNTVNITGSHVSYVDMLPETAPNSIDMKQYSHPASRTLTENISELTSGFVGNKNLTNAQMNIVTGFDVNTNSQPLVPIGKDPKSVNMSAPLL